MRQTGLYYYGARYYNPKTSLWLSVDPLAEKMPSWSPYAYTYNNPVRFVDPTGMIAEDCPNCPKPEKADEARYGSDGKYYMATPVSENSKSLEWVRTYAIPEITLKPSAKAQARYNFMQAHSRLHAAYEETRIGREIGAFERFLFIEAPFSFVGGELFSLGWRAVGAGKYLGQGWGYLSSRFAAKETVEIAAKTGAKLYSQATFNAFERQLSKDGMKSILKTQSRIQKNLAEHVQKLGDIKRLEDTRVL